MTDQPPSSTWEKIMEENAATATREHPWSSTEPTREIETPSPFGAPPPPPPPA